VLLLATQTNRVATFPDDDPLTPENSSANRFVCIQTLT
jgi:hypothetical protein